MRHRVYGKHLSRDKNQRTSLFRGLIRSLILQEAITTTEVKAKAIKGLVDKLITDGKRNSNSALISVRSSLPQAEVSKKLIEEIAPRYKNRVSGFTEMVKVGRRNGDGAMMVKMSLTKEEIKVSKQDKKEEEVKETKTEESAEKKPARKPRGEKTTK